MDQAENLRKLVKQQDKSKKFARVLTITSGKGGVGKSSISINLAIQFSRLGKRVIVFDADFALANIEVMMGIQPEYNLADLIFRGKDIKDIITPGIENVSFISGGSGVQELTKLTRTQIIYLIQRLLELDELADVIIIDTGAGITDAVLEFVISSAEVILVATPEPTSITDAYALLKTLNNRDGFSARETKIRMIANQIHSEKEGKEIYDRIGIVANKFLDIDLQYLGGIRKDSYVSKAIIQQKPISVLYPAAPASKCFVKLAAALMEDGINLPEEKRGLSKLFTQLFKIYHSKKD